MTNSVVIRGDGTVVWFGETYRTVEEPDEDLLSAYRNWYEEQIREENEHNAIPLQLAS